LASGSRLVAGDDSGEESVTGSIGTLGSSESTFLRVRDVPAEEMVDALSWRMSILGERAIRVSLEEDDDMADAEGEPADAVEVVKE
jgi:hypothetical protein